MAYGSNGYGRATQAAGTPITVLVPPQKRGFLRLTTLKYTAGATAHTPAVQRSLGRTKANGAANAGQAVVTLLASPYPAGRTPAAGDYVAIRHAVDGLTRLYAVASLNGTTLALTLSANLPVAVSNKDDVWLMGVAADTDPRTGQPHPSFSAPASATTTYTDPAAVVGTYAQDEPLLVYSANATNAGTVEQVGYGYAGLE